MDKMNEEIMTIKEVAKYLKMNEKTIYNLIKKKELPAFKLGGNWRFKKSIIDKWIEERLSVRKK